MSWAARAQLAFECARNGEAREDSFWSPWVVALRCGRWAAHSRRVGEDIDHAHPAFRAFLACQHYAVENAPFNNLAEFLSLEILRARVFPRCESRALDQLERFIQVTRTRCGSVHGDLHRGNLRAHHEKLAIIDWASYRPRFWAPYDRCHYRVCEIAAVKELGWIDGLQGNKDVMSSTELVIYMLARAELEASQDLRLARLGPQRVAKYARVVTLAAERI